ncbi:MAG TPA: asparagine synthase (glutamine-hydrolyzing) [Gemmatimonadaceae bacterium]|jgi:asparagine synthase (glutamine-hydrolysing)
MCGIAGFFGFDLSAEKADVVLRSMCDAIRHRGPDDEGYFAEPGIGLGMRRLSIVDLVTGHQPMSAGGGRFQIVFNGEIYNHARLRADLAPTETFATTSDTEVMLRLFAREGVSAVQKLNGMFAVALFDRTERRLLLVRDRMGVKPLYWYWDGKNLLFGSEIKALLASGLMRAELDPRGVWDYLTCRFVPGPGSMWRGVQKLPPGHFLSLREGGAPEVVRYWDIPYERRSASGSYEEHLQTFESIFRDSVSLRMLADVPVGILLSGGLDSSAVAAMARESNPKVNTFSVGFRGSPETNEWDYARLVARHLGTCHHEIEIGQDEFVDFLPHMVRFTDEPLADLASVPLYYVSRLARETVKVALSGEGSDEILGGYDFELRVSDWDRRKKTWAGALKNALGLSAADQRRSASPPTMTNYLSSAEKTALMGLSFPETYAPLRAALERLGRQDPLHQVLYGFSQDWLVEDLLMKADKMSMANSLEVRTPFLDYRLVEWAARTPANLKVGQDKTGGGRYANKRVLRDFAKKHLPQEIITRPKQGFPVPVYEWFGGPLRHWATDMLGATARVRTLLDSRELDRRIQSALAPEAPLLDRHRLWNFLILELWMREWRV